MGCARNRHAGTNDSSQSQTGEEEKLEGPVLYVTLGFALIFEVGLFFLLPAGLGGLTERYLGSMPG